MRIRLATLNAWALPEPLSQDLPARIDAIGSALGKLELDVIAFQEVWTKASRKSLRAAGRVAGLVHCWSGDGHGGLGPGNAGGLLVLSRLPIEEVSFEPYALRGEAEQIANGEYWSGKGFVSLRLWTPEGSIILINTHLHARYTRSSPHKFTAHRTGQAIQLAVRFAQTSEPIVVVGDFNFREDEPDYQLLTRVLGLRDSAAVLDQRQPTTLVGNPYRTNRVGRRKDFVFVRDGQTRAITPHRIERIFDETLEIDGRPAAYSNHAGLLLEIDLEPRNGALAVARAPDRSVMELAARVLAEGESLARERLAGNRKLSGIGVGFALLAGAGAVAPKPVSRRKMLRMSLGTAALLGLTTSGGFSIASEVFVPDEIRAFQQAAKQLDELDRAALA